MIEAHFALRPTRVRETIAERNAIAIGHFATERLDSTLPMLTAEPPTSNQPTSTGSARRVKIRVHGGREHGRLISLSPGKNTVGSGPRCDVRIQEPGVQPMHFLVVGTDDGYRVRRWAPGALLNGATFDEARLEAGDRLTMGSIELQVVGPEALGNPPAAAGPANVLENPSVKTPWPDAESIELASPADVYRANLQLEPPARNAAQFARPYPVSKSQRRKLLAALRRHRDQYERLVGRVETLERQVLALRSGPVFAPQYDPPQPVEQIWQDDDATIVEGLNDKTLPESGTESTADDWLIAARAALSRDRSPWLEASMPPAEEPIEPTELDNFDEEVTKLRAQLTASECKVAEAQVRLATLEHELADSRRMLQHFAEERMVWQTQISDTEVRLAEYVDRIQELAGHLEEARGRVTEPTDAVESAAVAAGPMTSTAAPSSPSWGTAIEVTAVDTDSDTVEAVATEIAPEEETTTWTAEEDEPSGEPARDESTVWTELEPRSVEASTPIAADEEVEPVPADVDHALAHLRELSIWRQSPVEDIETVAAGSLPKEFSTATPVDEEQPETDRIEDSPAGSKAAESFIDRFAHLLPKDGEAEGAVSEKPPRAPQGFAGATSSAAPTSQAPHGIGSEATSGDDEESIEQYMAKMMDRLRGGGQASPLETSAAPISSASACTSPSAEETDESAGETSAEEPPPRPRPQAAELRTDMDSLRALANQSARHAIGVHTARTLRRKATSRFISAVVATVAALFFLFMAKSWDSLEFVTACIAAIAAIYWGQATCIAFVKAVRSGAFDVHDENFTAIDGSKLPPVDGVNG